MQLNSKAHVEGLFVSMVYSQGKNVHEAMGYILIKMISDTIWKENFSAAGSTSTALVILKPKISLEKGLYFFCDTVQHL